MTDPTDFFDMKAAPMRIGTVTLKVRELDAVSSFYQRVLGLTPAAESKAASRWARTERRWSPCTATPTSALAIRGRQGCSTRPF